MARILLVEDDEKLLKLYKVNLEKANHQVLETVNGMDGYLIAKNEKPDLILLDVMLPGGTNGFDVLEKLKKDTDTKNIPVIMLTNLDGQEEIASEIGAQEYIIKSNITPSDLITKVNSFI